MASKAAAAFEDPDNQIKQRCTHKTKVVVVEGIVILMVIIATVIIY